MEVKLIAKTYPIEGASDMQVIERAARDLGYDPYVMVYDKPHAPKEIRNLQRWCNNKIVFKSCPKFEDYGKV